MHRWRWVQRMGWVASLWLVLLVCEVPAAPRAPRTTVTRAVCPRALRVTFLGNTAYVKWLVPSINRATQEIAIGMFQFVLGPQASDVNQVVQALIAAAKRGVRVTVVLDQPPEGDTPQAPNHQVAEEFRRQGITVQFDAPERMAHTKLVVIDQRYVFIGSHNLTQSALRYNHEASVLIDSPRLARQALAYLKGIAPSPSTP